MDSEERKRLLAEAREYLKSDTPQCAIEIYKRLGMKKEYEHAALVTAQNYARNQKFGLAAKYFGKAGREDLVEKICAECRSHGVEPSTGEDRLQQNKEYVNAMSRVTLPDLV